MTRPTSLGTSRDVSLAHAAVRIFQSGPDAEHNRIVYVSDRVSEAMLRALAARFGSEALAVRIERNPQFRNL